MKILLSINKKAIALLLSVLVILSSFSLIYTSKVSADTTSRSTHTKMMYQDPFTANGSHIVATKSIAGTDIKKGYSMATSYINDDYMNKVYCLNMGNHPYTSKLDSTTGGDWGNFDWRKKEAIGNIIALGLAGNVKGSADNYGTSSNPKYYKVINNVTSYPINNKAVKYHRTYSNTKYGNGTFSDSEIYIACQLLVWEITKGYRKTSSLNKTSKSLVEAYSNRNVRTVYNFIANRIYYLNKTPSFTKALPNDPKINVYNFDVTYDAKNKKYSFSPSALKISSSTKGVLRYYPDLAKNMSVSFKDTAGNTKYLNIDANISGDSLTLTPKTVTSTVPSGYNKGNLAYSLEKELPTGNDEKLEIKNNIIAYMPSKGELENGQNQVGINANNCWIDPRRAYYKVSADYSTTNINRDFSIQKDMRIISETSESGYKSGNSSLDSMEEGYYYYVKLPNGNDTYTVVEDGKLVTKKSDCQNSATALGLKTSDICYNKTLQEYYVIIGPTNSEGVTQSISSYIAKYVKSGINKSSIPYGNYYAFELGKADTSKGWKETTAINSSTSDLLDMNPEHYTIPDNVEPYHYTYQEHLKAKDSSLSAIRQGIDTSTTEGKIAYYNRLKRIYIGPNATQPFIVTYVNLTPVRIRLHKTADDNVVGRILFQIQKKTNNKWVNLDITNYIKDQSYMSFLTNFSNGQFMTYNSTVESIGREKGYSPYLYLPAGDYRITELGHYDDNDKLEFRDYLVKPDPIEFNIGDDDSIIDEYVENNTVEYDVENTSSVQLRLFKKGDDGIPLNGAEYELYNENGNLLTTLKTDTMNIDDVKYDGVAVADFMRLNTKYTVKEVKAPDGYLIDNTVYEIKFNQLDLKNQKDGTYSNHYDVTLTDKQTSAYITKTDITGENELAGAKLKVYSNGDSTNVIDEWVSTTEPHKIEGLVAGKTYVLEEITPPDGYVTSNIIFFKVNEDGTPTKVTMKDDITSYQFIKQDNKGNILAGAKLQLSDDETKDVVAEWTTSDTPYTVSKLTVGKTYRLKELSAPSAKYKLADDITFTVKDTSEIQTITMTDEIYYGSVTIQKQDDEGNNIGGAEFELYKADGTKLSTIKNDDGKYSCSTDGTVTTLPTDSDGKLVIDNLELGDYYLTESKAPNGKLPYTGKIEFTISSDSEESLNQSFTVKDDNVVMLDTGGKGYSIPLTIGIVLLLLSSSIIFIYYRRKKQ